MNEETTTNTQLELLKKRLPNVDDETLQSLLDDSKSIALNELFPFKEELPTELPSKYLNWQLRVCTYMWKNRHLLGFKSYEENNLKIVLSGDTIPSSFMKELVPHAGSIKRQTCNTEESTNV